MYQLLIFAFQSILALTSNETGIPCNPSRYEEEIKRDQKDKASKLSESFAGYKDTIGSLFIGRPGSSDYGFVNVSEPYQDLIEGAMTDITLYRKYDSAIEWTAFNVASNYTREYIYEYLKYWKKVEEEYKNLLTSEDEKAKNKAAEERRHENIEKNVTKLLEGRYPSFMFTVVTIHDTVGDAFLTLARNLTKEQVQVSQELRDSAGYGCSLARFITKENDFNRLAVLLGCVPRNVTCTLVNITDNNGTKTGELESWWYENTVSPKIERS
ncbi:unnamed protein product [Cylicocyclus nassatus]|uniref:Uncharacterized protein n=1 Tax=Cylicocyclus nassatus TaxID=53992 RepID=A0AA36M435_CYLNA|nr:unnamed protein product [Cylicocyclus nassatus]